MFVKIKSQGEDVKTIQESLIKLGYKPGPIDGLFGEKTETAVIKFQEEHNLYADGIVGPNTWKELIEAMRVHLDEDVSPVDVNESRSSILRWSRVPADQYGDGYDRFFLRQDAAEAYMRVRKNVLEAGGQLTSSGARRSLRANLNSSRSATSFHYTGRALDLLVSSGMNNHQQDPYVITADNDRYWRVFARASGGQQMDLEAVTYDERKKKKPVSGRFIDLTALFESEGFKRIKARRSFFQGGTWLGAEWWHFQYEKGLAKGESTFGDELLKVYTEDQVKLTPPWRYRNRIFGVDWF